MQKQKSKKKLYNLQVSEKFFNSNLDQFLCFHFEKTIKVPISRKKCKVIIERRDIIVTINDKKVTKASYKVSSHDQIEVSVPLQLIKELSIVLEIKDKIELTEQHIIWEDKQLLIASKPKGIPSLQTLDPRRDYFLAAVKRLLLKRDEREGYLALHHRLDVETSGLMLFSKKKSLNKDIGELFSKRKIQKTYHAKCHFSQELKKKNWEIKNYLKQKEKRSLKRISVKSGGDFAHSSFEIINIDQQNKTILVAAMPHTGRTHQLRVHLSEYGYPIVGDSVYGVRESDEILQLHCKKLAFRHPITNEAIEVTDRY